MGIRQDKNVLWNRMPVGCGISFEGFCGNFAVCVKFKRIQVYRAGSRYRQREPAHIYSKRQINLPFTIIVYIKG